MEPKC